MNGEIPTAVDTVKEAEQVVIEELPQAGSNNPGQDSFPIQIVSDLPAHPINDVQFLVFGLEGVPFALEVFVQLSQLPDHVEDLEKGLSILQPTYDRIMDPLWKIRTRNERVNTVLQNECDARRIRFRAIENEARL